MLRVLVSGGRDWGKEEREVHAVERVIESLPNGSVVIEGEARGADSLARDLALARGLQVLRFPAKWKEHGPKAGPIRNQQMLDEGFPQVLIYFHDDLSQSRGTAHMVRAALKAGVKTYRYDQWLSTGVGAKG